MARAPSILDSAKLALSARVPPLLPRASFGRGSSSCTDLAALDRVDPAGERRADTVPARNGMRVHGVLWVVHKLEAAAIRARSLLDLVLKVWQAEEVVFLRHT